MRRGYRGLLLGLLLLGIGLSLSIAFNPLAEMESEAVAIPLEGQRQIVARIDPPVQASTPLPVMLLC